MKLNFIKLGRTKYAEIDALVDIYSKRLNVSFGQVQRLELKEKNPPELTAEVERICQQSYVIALDESGKHLTSRQLADALLQVRDFSPHKSVTFLVGGSYGLPEQAFQYAKLKLSLSIMTFTGDHAWLLLWEQVYRATTIIQGTSYHHG